MSHSWPPGCKSTPDFPRTFDPDSTRNVLLLSPTRPPLRPGRPFDERYPFDPQHGPTPTHISFDERHPEVYHEHWLYTSIERERWIKNYEAERTDQIKTWQRLNSQFQRDNIIDPQFTKAGFNYPCADELCDTYGYSSLNDSRKPEPETDLAIRLQKRSIEEAYLYNHELRTVAALLHKSPPVIESASTHLVACVKEINQLAEDIEEEESKLKNMQPGQPAIEPIWARGKHWTIPPELAAKGEGLMHHIETYESWECSEPSPPINFFDKLGQTLDLFNSSKLVRLCAGSQYKSSPSTEISAETISKMVNQGTVRLPTASPAVTSLAYTLSSASSSAVSSSAASSSVAMGKRTTPPSVNTTPTATPSSSLTAPTQVAARPDPTPPAPQSTPPIDIPRRRPAITQEMRMLNPTLGRPPPMGILAGDENTRERHRRHQRNHQAAMDEPTKEESLEHIKALGRTTARFPPNVGDWGHSDAPFPPPNAEAAAKARAQSEREVVIAMASRMGIEIPAEEEIIRRYRNLKLGGGDNGGDSGSASDEEAIVYDDGETVPIDMARGQVLERPIPAALVVTYDDGETVPIDMIRGQILERPTPAEDEDADTE